MPSSSVGRPVLNFRDQVKQDLLTLGADATLDTAAYGAPAMTICLGAQWPFTAPSEWSLTVVCNAPMHATLHIILGARLRRVLLSQEVVWTCPVWDTVQSQPELHSELRVGCIN